GGVDTAEYTRALYAPHPILSGLISKRGLITAIALFNLVDLAILVALVTARGWTVAAFALAGLFVSVFYVAPPLRLKHHGLGEPGVFLVWGPLMIGGTYYVTAGTVPGWLWLATIPYAITVTTVLIGKHVDKYDQDRARGIHTLPVLLGKAASLRLNQALMLAFYPVVLALVACGWVGAGVLLVAAAIPRLVKVLRAYSEPKPAAPPPGYRLWPLWYVSIAFYHNRLAGGLFVLGLLVNVALRRGLVAGSTLLTGPGAGGYVGSHACPLARHHHHRHRPGLRSRSDVHGERPRRPGRRRPGRRALRRRCGHPRRPVHAARRGAGG